MEGHLTLFTLTSCFMSGSLMEGDLIDPPPLFCYCNTSLEHWICFWKALGLYFINLQQKVGKFAKI